MKETERLLHFPDTYGGYFSDVFEHFEQRGDQQFEWSYGRNDRYRISFNRDSDLCSIRLDSITYDGDFIPDYRRIYEIDELRDTGIAYHRVHDYDANQIPHEAYTEPELVLRGLLHALQSAIQLRLE